MRYNFRYTYEWITHLVDVCFPLNVKVKKGKRSGLWKEKWRNENNMI